MVTDISCNSKYQRAVYLVKADRPHNCSVYLKLFSDTHNAHQSRSHFFQFNLWLSNIDKHIFFWVNLKKIRGNATLLAKCWRSMTSANLLAWLASVTNIYSFWFICRLRTANVSQRSMKVHQNNMIHTFYRKHTIFPHIVV